MSGKKSFFSVLCSGILCSDISVDELKYLLDISSIPYAGRLLRLESMPCHRLMKFLR